jgi:hypothetical protein
MPRDQVLFEGEPPIASPPSGASDHLPADPSAVAEYWASENARRWSTARDISDRYGWVVCDTDPFKLHWSWTLWVKGLSSLEYWQRCREVTRQAFEDGRLGLPDLVFFADLDAQTLRRQKAADLTRTRRRHEMHVSIAPALKRWYSAMAKLDPTRVQFGLPPSNGIEARHLRLGSRTGAPGAEVFDQFIAELDSSSAA